MASASLNSTSRSPVRTGAALVWADFGTRDDSISFQAG